MMRLDFSIIHSGSNQSRCVGLGSGRRRHSSALQGKSGFRGSVGDLAEQKGERGTGRA